MFKIIMRGGDCLFDERFRNVLIETLAERTSGSIYSEYDVCILMLDDVYSYEDENSDYIDVNPPVSP